MHEGAHAVPERGGKPEKGFQEQKFLDGWVKFFFYFTLRATHVLYVSKLCHPAPSGERLARKNVCKLINICCQPPSFRRRPGKGSQPKKRSRGISTPRGVGRVFPEERYPCWGTQNIPWKNYKYVRTYKTTTKEFLCRLHSPGEKTSHTLSRLAGRKPAEKGSDY